jgi:DNA transformation protein
MDPEHIRELFAGFGSVTPRRMFGGLGVFADGLMIALVIDGLIYLKADDRLAPDFEREGTHPFSYATGGGRRTVMSYWRLPDRLYDDVDELAEWARRSLEAARRSATRPRSATAKRTLRRAR